MRKTLASTIMVGAVGLAAYLIGGSARGDFQGDEPVRDLVAGLGILGGVVAVKWAANELDGGQAGDER